MKQERKIWIVIILLFALVVITAKVCNAQNWKKGLAVAGYHVGTIALGAVVDAQYDMGNKNLSHALHAAEVGALIGGPFVFRIEKSDALSYILSYGFLRLSFFDSFYNMTRDLPLLYTGSTSTYDKVMSGIPPDGRAVIKSWSLVLGIAIPINELR